MLIEERAPYKIAQKNTKPYSPRMVPSCQGHDGKRPQLSV